MGHSWVVWTVTWDYGCRASVRDTCYSTSLDLDGGNVNVQSLYLFNNVGRHGALFCGISSKPTILKSTQEIYTLTGKLRLGSSNLPRRVVEPRTHQRRY